MRTLASELGSHAERLSGQPRVYVDANMPAGLVAFMRTELLWDVLFVIEHDDLRRARSTASTIACAAASPHPITLDSRLPDDRRFPPARAGGLLVLMARIEKGLALLDCPARPGSVPARLHHRSMPGCRRGTAAARAA